MIEERAVKRERERQLALDITISFKDIGGLLRGPGLRGHDPKRRKLQRSGLIFHEPHFPSGQTQVLDIRQNLRI